jgi:hypothetical protein
MSARSFYPQLEELGSRVLPSANPALTISDATIVEGNAGSQNALVSVNLSGPSTRTVKVDYRTANGTALAGSDYDAVSGTLTFVPGQTRASILVAVRGDLLAEPDETFSIKLSNARNATIANAVGTVTILDDGDAKPGISISDAAAREGDYLNFTVRLSMPSAQPVTVDYCDEWGNRGTLTFAPGETIKTISIWTGPDDGVFNSPYFGPGQDPVARTDQVSLFNVPPNARILDGVGDGTVYESTPVPSWYPITYVDGSQDPGGYVA